MLRVRYFESGRFDSCRSRYRSSVERHLEWSAPLQCSKVEWRCATGATSCLCSTLSCGRWQLMSDEKKRNRKSATNSYPALMLTWSLMTYPCFTKSEHCRFAAYNNGPYYRTLYRYLEHLEKTKDLERCFTLDRVATGPWCVTGRHFVISINFYKKKVSCLVHIECAAIAL